MYAYIRIRIRSSEPRRVAFIRITPTDIHIHTYVRIHTYSNDLRRLVFIGITSGLCGSMTSFSSEYINVCMCLDVVHMYVFGYACVYVWAVGDAIVFKRACMYVYM